MEHSINPSVQHLRHPAALRLHCRSVSRAGKVIAEALTISGMIVDADKVAVMGMIHDVGRGITGDARHGVEGYWLAREAGFSPDVARICVSHMTMGRTMKEVIEIGLLNTEEARRLEEAGVILENMSLEEEIVGMVDSRVLSGRFVSLEERIDELEKRRGPLPPSAQYNLDRIAELATSFERALGHSLAQLFPGGQLGLESVQGQMHA